MTVFQMFDFGRDSAPDPAVGAHSAPSDSLAGFKGPTSKGSGGQGREGHGRGRRRGGEEERSRRRERGEGEGGTGAGRGSVNYCFGRLSAEDARSAPGDARRC